MAYKKEIENLALKAFSKAIKENKNDTIFAQLLTRKEKMILGRRILIAQAILEGKTRYEISNHITLSPNTFTQIKQWLASEFPEYQSSYNVNTFKTPPPPRKTYAEPFTYQYIKQKYPGHFLLFSLVEELFSLQK